MKLLAGILGVALLLALLTWLLVRGIDTQATAYAAMLRAFDDFALAEAALHRDILQCRAGLLRNYDELDKAIEAMESGVARLRSYVEAEGLDAGPTDRLAVTVADEEELTERFKTNNALLQNSLSYVSLQGAGPAFAAQNAQLTYAASALAATILQLTRDTSLQSVLALQQRIEGFAAQAPASGPESEAAQALLGHARLLRDLLPAVDLALKALVAAPSQRPLSDTRALFAQHRSVIEATALRFRLSLYVVSLLLLLLLVRFGLWMRTRARIRQARTAFEHAIAENSTRLINCPPAEIGTRLRQALSEICRSINVERGYVVLAETPTRVHAWSADGAPYQPGWPEQALDQFARIGSAGLDIATVRDVAALAPGKVKSTFESVGLRAWACVPLVRPGRARGILGFDAFRPAWDIVFPLSVARLAGDAIANALEREDLERDRTKLAARLERARRMQAIGSMASGIAHNFNNIIGAILGYSEMIEPQLAAGTRPAQYIEEIRRAAERARDLIDNILSFGRRRDAHTRAVQVGPLLTEAGSLLRASLSTDIELVIGEIPPDVAVSGEPAQLQQVTLNLCANAAQAMEGAGTIAVSAECNDVAAPTALSHGELAPGRYVCLAVADTGRGFDEAVARRLFEPFFTTRVAGTGLGLATVAEIMRDHDGAMNVESKPGHGSRFEAWLPASVTDGAERTTAATLPRGHGEVVLMIGSERKRLRRDEEMLAALGYEPVGFERIEDVIATCRASPDRFDVILISRGGKPETGLIWRERCASTSPDGRCCSRQKPRSRIASTCLRKRAFPRSCASRSSAPNSPQRLSGA
jgi:signal transduction histidine kinase